MSTVTGKNMPHFRHKMTNSNNVNLTSFLLKLINCTLNSKYYLRITQCTTVAFKFGKDFFRFIFKMENQRIDTCQYDLTLERTTTKKLLTDGFCSIEAQNPI